MSDELIVALANILTVPHPAPTEADEQLHARILRDRVTAAQGILAEVVSGTAPEVAAEMLRRRARELPVTYRTYERPEAPDARPGMVARGFGVVLEIPGGER